MVHTPQRGLQKVLHISQSDVVPEGLLINIKNIKLCHGEMNSVNIYQPETFVQKRLPLRDEYSDNPSGLIFFECYPSSRTPLIPEFPTR